MAIVGKYILLLVATKPFENPVPLEPAIDAADVSDGVNGIPLILLDSAVEDQLVPGISEPLIVTNRPIFVYYPA